MGRNSKIGWTHHTFNCWWGCEKVSPACAHCYAETWANRTGNDVWGKLAPRRFFGDKHWNEPLKWNEDAKAAGKPALVFCLSMGDVMEDRRDLDPWRARLWTLVEATPRLTWLLLTKRPENFLRLTPWAKERESGTVYGVPRREVIGTWPKNVWAMTTCENQEWADRRMPELMKVPAAVRGVSAEPLLGPIDFSPWLKQKWHSDGEDGPEWPAPRLDWVIVGGESGHGARPMKPEWAMAIKDQCRENGVPFFFKQKGAVLARSFGCGDKAGANPDEWPAEFRVQEFPAAATA